MLIFGMKAHLINTLVRRSRSSAKVKYQGYISQKMAVLRALVVCECFQSGQDKTLSFRKVLEQDNVRRL